MSRLGILLLLLSVTAPAGAAEDVRISARLEPETIGIEQLVTLTIEVEGGGARRLQPVAEFDLDNLEIAAGPYSQESFQFVNGTTSRSATIAWRLRALELGRGRVHSIVVRVGRQVAELADLEVVVQQEPVETSEPKAPQDSFDRLFAPFGERQRGRAARQRGEVFLRATVSPERAFVGQQVLYTLYLYTQSDISSINPENLPDFNGFWVHEIPQAKHYEPEMVEVDGKRFARVRLLERALFPLRPGRFELEATRALMAVRVPVTSMRLSLLSQTEEIQRVSNTVALTVEPLPEPAPPGFQGAVGDLDLDATLAPRRIEVGEASTLTLALAGRGLLQGLPDPELPHLSGVEIYPPQQRSTDEVHDGDVHGVRSWSYVLVPERPGTLDIPALELPYFDPASGSYRVATTEALRLEVLPSTRLSRAEPERRIHGIRSAAIPMAGSALVWWRRAPHLMMLGAMLGLMITWATRRSDRFTPEHRAAVHRLEDRVETLGEIDRPRRAAAELEAAWRDYLRDRWEIAPGTPANQWCRALVERGASERAGRDLEGLVEDLHYLRYAPQLSSTEALQRELVERSRQILRTLH